MDEKTEKIKDEKSEAKAQPLRTQTILSIFVLILALITVFFISDNKKCENQTHISLKTFWAYGRNIQSGYLHNVFNILERLGYKNDPNSTDWDLLWAHDYPFRTLYSKLNNLKPHQKVNHFPGCGYVTNKVDLATSGLKYIPPAFKLPSQKKELLEYTELNPSVNFVQKDNNHRHIHIRKISEIDLDDNSTFVQHFVDKPFLVGGHKFDIGIYTIITSIDPLRVYIYNGDALLRFCPVKYHPFDPNNLDKYVVGDDYLPTWEVPVLKYYYKELGFGMKESLNAYIRSQNKDPSVIWEQIEDSIRVVLLAKEPQIIDVVNRFPSKQNFFEMMRFDFVVDEDLKLSLMEANMSPNLSSAHFPPNLLLFEQVIYNLLSLVGIGQRVFKDTLVMSEEEERMQTGDKNIMVFPEECNSDVCKSSCVSPRCQLCKPCLSSEMKANLVRAHREHLNRADCKRIFPPPMTQKSAKSLSLEEYSAENQLQVRWFQGKCLLDYTWCK